MFFIFCRKEMKDCMEKMNEINKFSTNAKTTCVQQLKFLLKNYGLFVCCCCSDFVVVDFRFFFE